VKNNYAPSCSGRGYDELEKLGLPVKTGLADCEALKLLKF
jgi:hypothetical protein